MFTNDKQVDVDVLRQFRLLYMHLRSNKMLRMLYLYHREKCSMIRQTNMPDWPEL